MKLILSPEIDQELHVEHWEETVRDLKDFVDLIEKLFASTADIVKITKEALDNTSFFEDIASLDYKIPFHGSDINLGAMALIAEHIGPKCPHNGHDTVILASESEFETVALPVKPLVENIYPVLSVLFEYAQGDSSRLDVPSSVEELFEAQGQGEASLMIDATRLSGISRLLDGFSQMPRQDVPDAVIAALLAFQQSVQDSEILFDWAGDTAIGMIKQGTFHYGKMKSVVESTRPIESGSNGRARFVSPRNWEGQHGFKKQIERVIADMKA